MDEVLPGGSMRISKDKWTEIWWSATSGAMEVYVEASQDRALTLTEASELRDALTAAIVTAQSLRAPSP